MECYSYLLFSGTGNKQRTYIGATNNPDRRLRQHNAELSGGAFATKGRNWKRAVYVGGFPDWSAALQFEWSWKRHSRGRYGLAGKLQGLIRLLKTEKSTSKAIPFHMWPCKLFLEFSKDCPEIAEKIEAQNVLLELSVPPSFLPIFPSNHLSFTMSSIPTIEALASLVAELTTQVTTLKSQMDAALTKKPRAKKVKDEPKADGETSAADAEDTATATDAATAASAVPKAKKPRAKKVKADASGAAATDADAAASAEPKADGETSDAAAADAAAVAEPKVKKPRAKKVKAETEDTSAAPKTDDEAVVDSAAAAAMPKAKKPRAKKVKAEASAETNEEPKADAGLPQEKPAADVPVVEASASASA